MASAHRPSSAIATLSVPLDRDVFLRTVLRELAGTLQDIIGLAEASGFIRVVGQRMGQQLNRRVPRLHRC